jgi:hypothetical protein
MRNLFGLPAHPLLVHAPVVLVPLVTLGMILVAIRPSWRRRYGAVLLGGSVVAAVGLIFAMQSGEAFDEGLREAGNPVKIDVHQELAETAQLFTFAFVIVLVAMVVIDWRARSAAAQPIRSLSAATVGEPAAPGATSGMATVARALAAVAALFGVLATIWIIRTGHEGARLVWETTKI